MATISSPASAPPRGKRSLPRIGPNMLRRNISLTRRHDELLEMLSRDVAGGASGLIRKMIDDRARAGATDIPLA